MRLYLPNGHPGIQGYLLTRACIVAGGVMFAGIAWEIEGNQSRVTECAIVWFAMFSFYDLVFELMEGSR